LATTHPTLHDEVSGVFVARVQRYLAAGSSAAVFAGETPGGDLVAVKILLPRARRELAKRGLAPAALFDRERETHRAVAARLDGGSPHLCPVLGHGTVRVDLSAGSVSLPFLLTALVAEEPHGATLEERVLRSAPAGGPGLARPRLQRLFASIFAGTQALHAAGIVHRDLSPGNILVAGEPSAERALIADGGIARLPNSLTLGLSARTSSYGSPEQCLSPRVGDTASNPLVGPWSDVHALAALVFFAATGIAWAEHAGADAFAGGARPPLPRERLHPSVLPRAAALDDALQRGASPLLPEPLPDPRGDERSLVDWLRRMPRARDAQPPRPPSVEAFSQVILRLLAE
jgi:eukaryotic-like serine/threonine-protein kinase